MTDEMTIEEKIADINKHYWKRLTEWEEEFMDSINDIMELVGTIGLTAKRREIIEKIFVKYDEE